jgi:ribosome biogenesis GTPase
LNSWLACFNGKENLTMMSHLKEPPDPGSSQGTVIKKSNGLFTVRSEGLVFLCSLSTSLRLGSEPRVASERREKRREKQGKPSQDRRRALEPKPDPAQAIVVGDRVCFHSQAAGSGEIFAVLPRRNKLARRSAVPMPSARPHEQVIVANIDQVVPVFAAASPAPKWNLLDRYLVSAEAAGIPALVCITKLDLAGEEETAPGEALEQIVDEYREIGYPVILTSAATGLGMDELRRALAGRVSVLLGKSGVGKTTLLNALQPGLGLRVNEVSRATGKGKHTTTQQELFMLDSKPLVMPGNGDGGWKEAAIVDTPGIREFGLWDVDGSDLALFFPEMRPYIGRCRFGLDCRHDEEPGCAVRKAVTTGKISPRRYANLVRLSVER